jgi:hypothetical protein
MTASEKKRLREIGNGLLIGSNRAINSVRLKDGTIIRVGDKVRAPGESGHVAGCVVLWFERFQGRTKAVLTRGVNCGFRPTKDWFGTPVCDVSEILPC